SAPSARRSPSARAVGRPCWPCWCCRWRCRCWYSGPARSNRVAPGSGRKRTCPCSVPGPSSRWSLARSSPPWRLESHSSDMASGLFRFSSPASFFPLAGRLVPVFGWLAALLALAGLYIGFVVAPTDFQQGESYRIIFIHVPAAWMAMFTYLVIAGWSAASFIWNTRLSAMMAQALAPTGAMFAFVSLWSGAFWGRPTWGTYWVWDARLTSTLILLFLYLGLMALRSAIEDPRRADRACAVLALVGS